MCHHSAHHARQGWRHDAHQGHKNHWKQGFAQRGYPPVHVEEGDDQYEIKLYAAGYVKTDFQVKLAGDLLLISVDKPEYERDPYTHRGLYSFQPGNFEKRFELNDKVDSDRIQAKYEEGILTVTLPKREGFETVRKDIGIV